MKRKKKKLRSRKYKGLSGQGDLAALIRGALHERIRTPAVGAGRLLRIRFCLRSSESRRILHLGHVFFTC